MNIENVMQLLPPPPVNDTPVDTSYHTISIPLIGRIRCVKDPQGQMFVAALFAYWLYGFCSVYFIILIPAYDDGLIPSFVTHSFLAVSILCLLSLLRASLTNPGQLPSNSEADATWNQCKTCNRLRPPRAHHCRRCGQCVLRMDHHCPWINNCVGEGNHFAFLQLLLYAFIMGSYCLVLNLLHFWVFPKCVSCNKNAFHIKYSIWFMYLTFILSANMASMMGGQFCQQHFNILLNRTVLETMSSKNSQVVYRSKVRRWFSAYRELCGQGLVIFWFWPLGRRRPVLPYQSQNTV